MQNDMNELNRLRVVLCEKERTSKWLVEQTNVNPSTLSAHSTNSSQPDRGSLLKISELLKVDLRELIVREYNSYLNTMILSEGGI